MEEISYRRGGTPPFGHLLVIKRKDGWWPPNKCRVLLLKTRSLGHSRTIKTKLGSLPYPENKLISCNNFSGWLGAIVFEIRSISYGRKITTAKVTCEVNEKNWTCAVEKESNCPATARNWIGDSYPMRPPTHRTQSIKTARTKKMQFLSGKL